MVNRALHGESLVAARGNIGIVGIFRNSAPSRPDRGNADDSNFTKIIRAFESALNQTRTANPTAFSAAAATFGAGNKTKRDVTGED